MLTVGVDLAAEHPTTAVASIRWTDAGAVVEAVTERACDDVLLAAIKDADKAGIDCPLGWLAPFVEFVVAHHAGTLTTPSDLVGRDWRRGLTWRRTDLVTHRPGRTGRSAHRAGTLASPRRVRGDVPAQ